MLLILRDCKAGLCSPVIYGPGICSPVIHSPLAGSAIDKKVKNVKCVQDHLVLGWEIGDDDIYEKK